MRSSRVFRNAASRKGSDPFRLLVLGGTAEARELATALDGAGVAVTTSLAGRTRAPGALAGSVRFGGFGGVDGLAAALDGFDAVVDATHPFAAAMSANAEAACAAAGLPLLRLLRPGFAATPEDRWTWVASLGDAAAATDALGTRALITTGRQELGPFAGLRAWALLRSIEPPEPPLPARHEVLLERGPFTLASERQLLERWAIDVVVTKDSGGSTATLDAARERGIPVVVVARPAPASVASVAEVAEAVRWVMMRG